MAMVTSGTSPPAVVFENTYKCMLAHLLWMSSSQWGGPVAMLNVPGKHKNLQPDSDREDIISISIINS